MNCRVLFGWILVVSFLSAWSIEAHAEGRCPPGQYPVGGQGVGGCAPIPGGPGGSAAQPRATGKWIKTWGAISTSPATGAAGVTTGKFRKAEALAQARSQCASKGATDCTAGFAYKNQCVALVDPPPGSGRRSGVSSGPTVEVAVRSATETCQKSGEAPCVVSYSDCTKPVFEAF